MARSSRLFFFQDFFKFSWLEESEPGIKNEIKLAKVSHQILPPPSKLKNLADLLPGFAIQHNLNETQ